MRVGETRFAQSQNIKKARLVFITPGDMRAGCVFPPVRILAEVGQSPLIPLLSFSNA